MSIPDSTLGGTTAISYVMALLRVYRVDIALHTCLFLFSPVAGATSFAFAYGHVAHWIYLGITTITTITIIYSIGYTYTYKNQSYPLSLTALIILVLFWSLVLILPWIWMPYVVYEVAARLSIGWTPLANASIVFCTLSVATLNLIPLAAYARYRNDTVVHDQRESLHHLSEAVVHRSWQGAVNQLPDNLVLCGFGWWQHSDCYSHQFVVAEFEDMGCLANRCFVRVEREKSRWTPWRGDLETYFSTSSREATLTTSSFCVARYTVNRARAQRDQRTLVSIGSVINRINDFSSSYSFLAFNCWWFAGCSFFCIAHLIEPPNLTIHCSREANHELAPSTFEEAMAFCEAYYFRSHWPYWVLVGHPMIVVAGSLSLITNWSFLGYAIAPALILMWLIYYIIIIAGAWRIVREIVRPRGIDVDHRVGLRLAWRAVGVAVLLMCYGGLFLALASIPGLAISREAKSVH